jgi:hypothetical protein
MKGVEEKRGLGKCQDKTWLNFVCTALDDSSECNSGTSGSSLVPLEGRKSTVSCSSGTLLSFGCKCVHQVTGFVAQIIPQSLLSFSWSKCCPVSQFRKLIFVLLEVCHLTQPWARPVQSALYTYTFSSGHVQTLSQVKQFCYFLRVGFNIIQSPTGR